MTLIEPRSTSSTADAPDETEARGTMLVTRSRASYTAASNSP